MMEQWNLPEGWGEIKLSDLCRFVSGGTPNTKNKDYFSGTIPWITGADITDDKITSPRHYITNKAIQNSATNVVPTGNILLVTRTGVGKVAITDCDICISQDFTGLLPDRNRVDVRYLYRYLQSQKAYFVDNQRGATIKGVTRDVVASLDVFLPYPDDPGRSLTEQRRIVARLEALLGEVRAMRDLVQSMRRQWDELMQSALAEVFPAHGQDLPQGWEWIKVGEVAELYGGSTPRRHLQDYFGGDIVWVTPTDLPVNGLIPLITSSKVTLTQAGLDSCSARLLPVGTVLFSSRASIGKIGIAGIELATNQGFINFACKDVIYNKYLAWVLRFLTPQIQNLASSTTYLEISKSVMRQFPIPIPYPSDPARSLQEQRRIVARLEAVQAEVSAARQALEADERRIAALEQSILAAAFRGEL